jgi:NAD+-dependent protein deacetylase sirtuin 5
MTPEEMQSFRECLANANRVVALCGAGLSAASGLGVKFLPHLMLTFETFRGAGGWWRNHEATKLATPEAFSRDPSLVWQFYAYRRHKALHAKPNPAHFALAEYTRQNPGKVFTITQNVDGLSLRAGHPEENIVAVHGDLWSLKCERARCDYSEKNLKDPVVPALRVEDFPDDEDLPGVTRGELPHCPKCKSLLRPGVVFFNEQLPGLITSDYSI